mgnify:CR=1 FL=1
MVNMICEIFHAEVLRLVVSLQERGISVELGDHDRRVVLKPSAALTANDRQVIAVYPHEFGMAAAFAHSDVVRHLVERELRVTKDADGPPHDAPTDWRLEIARAIAHAIVTQCIADHEAA